MLKKIYINKDGKKIDLSKLSLKQLNYLNLEEEEYFAKEIKKRNKFSKERNDYIKKSYKKVFQIADWKRNNKENKTINKGNGVTDNTVQLLKDIIKKEIQYKKNITFFEAGVGTGYAIEQLLEEYENTINIKGCDIFLSDNVKNIIKNNNNIYIPENNLYDELDNIEDESIDIFYADNVLEHIVNDEYDETVEKISKKIKPNGIAIFIIPNLYTGPNDISKIKKKKNNKATGFHFMESYLKNNIEIFKKYNLYLNCFCFRNKNKEIKHISNLLILNYVKVNVEKILGKIRPKVVRNRIFKRLGYDVYILKKH